MGMKNNIGDADRLGRILVGALLLVAGLAAFTELIGLGTTVGGVAVVLGVVLVATGLVRMCLLYRLLGIDTSNPR